MKSAETVSDMNLIEGFRAAFAPTSVLIDPNLPIAGSPDVLLHLPADAAAPSAILYDAVRQWVYLLDAVPTHGPITPARRQQLAEWTAEWPAGKVYVSVFPNRLAFQAHADCIAWHTEVWLADAPHHLIHYGGDRFNGPR